MAKLNLAVEGNRATVEWRATAGDIYGFERAPRDAEEERLRDAGLETLRTRFAEGLVFDPALGCRVEAVSVGLASAPGDGHGHAGSGHQEDHGHGHADEDAHGHADEDAHGHAEEDAHGHEDEEAHGHAEGQGAHGEGEAGAGEDGHDHSVSDVDGRYEVTCQQPLAGSVLRLQFGTLFPSLQHIDVQLLGDQSFGGRYRATGARLTL